MNKYSKIFVAGGSGMVGSAIIRKLIQKGYENIISNYLTKPPRESKVVFYRIDLRSQKETEDFFCQQKPDYVFLSAAKVGGILANNTYKAEFIYDNMAIALNVINAAYKYKVKKLINLGSSCIYPKFAPQPLKEEYLLTSTLEPTNEPYAIAKISAIKLCRYYNEQYNTDFISLMPTNLFGPFDNYNLETSHVLPALIRKFHLAKLLKNKDFDSIKKDIKKYPLGFSLRVENGYSIKELLERVGISGDYVVVWGSGEVYREFLHVDDAADACVFAFENIKAEDLKNINPDYFVNVGRGEDIKLKELVEIIKNIIGFDGKVIYDTSKPDGTVRKLLDVSKLFSLGWRPKIDLIEGIKMTYRWYFTESLSEN